MPFRTRFVPFLLAAAFAAGCSDAARGPAEPDFGIAGSPRAGEQVPPRTEDLAGYWERMSDAELWTHLEAQDGQAVFGVKNSGEARGIWRNQILVTPANFAGAENALRGRPGVDVVDVSRRPPFVVVRIQSLEALAAVRALPFRDYLQPLMMHLDGESAMMDGCGWGDVYTGGAPYNNPGEPIPPGLARMGIVDAWRRNAGEAAVIGVADTGVSHTQANLLENFATGASAPSRWHDVVSVVDGGTNDQCGHGTRLAGLSFGPNNASSMVGAAWNANAVSVRQGNGVSTSGGLNSAYVASATVMAVDQRFFAPHNVNKRRIVSMAWGARSSHSNVEDAIRYNHGRGALHLAASGTTDWWGTWYGVVFPATMTEVIAVSAVNPDRSRVNNVHYGSDVELAAYVDQLGTGQFTIQTRTVAGSSAATAAMAGIAALVWTQYPNETNEQIRQRLRAAGHLYPNRTSTHGFGVVNAHRAVGGMTVLHVGGPDYVYPNQPTAYTVGTSHDGDGPFSYLWSDGTTGQSTSITLGPDDCMATVNATVTDLTEGFARHGSHTIRVLGSDGLPKDCTCDPRFEICDPISAPAGR